jgi:predicted nucleotidyltransferase
MKIDRKAIREKLKILLSEYQNAILVFLFGSCAKNDMTVFSDLDIAILFREKPDIYVLNELREKLEGTFHMAVDIVTLNNASPIIKMQVLKNGIVLVNKDARVYYKFFVNTVKEYDDLKRIRKEIEDNILKGRIYA